MASSLIRHHLSLLRRRLRRARRRGRRCLGRPGPPRQWRPALLERRGARRNARHRWQTAFSADRRPQCEPGTKHSIGSPATFTQTIADHGPDAVALYVSGQFLTEDYYVANKLMKGFIGSANIDTNSRLCMASSVAGHIRAFGEDIVPGCYDDIEAADLAVLVGSNTAWCHPVLYQRLVAAREKRGTKVVVIDPRRTPTCDIADIHLAIRARHRCGGVRGLVGASDCGRRLRRGMDAGVRVRILPPPRKLRGSRRLRSPTLRKLPTCRPTILPGSTTCLPPPSAP